MTTRMIAAMIFIAGVSLLSPASAQPLEKTQIEINYLLDFTEISGCQFYRNGSWYDSRQAQEHLRDKYDYLAARNKIHTAEDFISKAASKSSLSGRLYEVRCGVCANTQTSGDWLAATLVRYRTVMARQDPPPDELHDH